MNLDGIEYTIFLLKVFFCVALALSGGVLVFIWSSFIGLEYIALTGYVYKYTDLIFRGDGRHAYRVTYKLRVGSDVYLWESPRVLSTRTLHANVPYRLWFCSELGIVEDKPKYCFVGVCAGLFLILLSIVLLLYIAGDFISLWDVISW